jgi:sugar O-acyltransferase (sialic acid O-acetyltransferase NeuD family)
MEKIVIIGASGYGGEVLGYVKAINEKFQQYYVLGFIDDDKTKHGKTMFSHKVIGDISWFNENKDVGCIIAIGDPANRKKIYGKLKDKGIKVHTIIHPSAIIGENASIGEGCIIGANTILTVEVTIGKCVILNINCTVGHCSTIGSFSTINPSVNISGDCTIYDGVYLGTNSSIIHKTSIGEGSVIGAGAVVIKDIESYVTAVGVPAKVIN